MPSHRYKNAVWSMPDAPMPAASAQLGVLMDIRDDLQALNRFTASALVTDALLALRRSGHTLDRLDARVARKIKLR